MPGSSSQYGTSRLRADGLRSGLLGAVGRRGGAGGASVRRSSRVLLDRLDARVDVLGGVEAEGVRRVPVQDDLGAGGEPGVPLDVLRVDLELGADRAVDRRTAWRRR